MKQEDMKKVLEVGVLLSSQRDLPRLLEEILARVMDLARCDAGTLYLLENGALHFKIMHNHSMGKYDGGDGRDPDLPPVALKRENVCALSFLENRTICIEDVYNCSDYNFSGPRFYDAQNGYHTQSMLVVPLRGREGEMLGVLQLINAMDGEGKVTAFSPDMVLVLESVASQSAITIQNVRYLREIRGLFQSFVDVMSAAIDKRTPYNASHSRRMADCGMKFWDFLAGQEETAGSARFTPERKEELRMSLLLHDIGKVTTPLEVMNKEERLRPDQKTAFLHRMEVIRLRGEIEQLSGRISKEELDALRTATRDAETLVGTLCGGAPLKEEQKQALAELAGRTYLGGDGAERPWLEPDEMEMLSIFAGTLSPAEREKMEEHVVMTDRLLSQIHFSRDLSHVQAWAAAHHELLNGAGYPRHLSAEDIPFEVRVMTILDIFDALVASDRPYKRAKPIPVALDILSGDAERGRLDAQLVRLFKESRCWEEFYDGSNT